jgi:hypothetical protein
MAKYRTRKQKEKARHHFLLSWQPEAKNRPPEAGVKGQNNIGYEAKFKVSEEQKNANNMAQEASTKAIKYNIIKSLIMVSFILCLELVIYLAWK